MSYNLTVHILCGMMCTVETQKILVLYCDLVLYSSFFQNFFQSTMVPIMLQIFVHSLSTFFFLEIIVISYKFSLG